MRLEFIFLQTSLAAFCTRGTHKQCGSDFAAYSSTFWPNLLGQWSSTEVDVTFGHFYPLRQMECSPLLDMFLCSALSPACVDNDLSGTLPYLVPVPPCRELCELVTSSCASLISEFDIQWPAEFSCDRLPRSSEAQCIPAHDLSQPLPFQLSWTSTEINDEFSIFEKEETEPLCPAEQITENQEATYGGIKGCTGPCEPKETTETETKLVRLIVGIFAAAGAIASCFSITCFYIDKKRFQYPEKPAVFFAFCYAGICLILLTGIVSPFRIACASKKLENVATGEVFEQAGLVNGIEQNMCTLIFMAQFYLSGAALCWWIILMISWALAAIFKWSSESISQVAPFFHLFCWTFPAILTSTALYHRLVTGDAFLNSCILSSTAFSNWLLLFFPTVFFFFTGSAIFMAGLFALRNDLTPKTKSALLVHRIILFTIFFMLPKSAFLLVKFYENDNKAAWELAVLQGSNLRPGFVFILLEKLLPLLPAFAPLVWAANRKSLERWGSSTASSVLTNSSFAGSGKGSESSRILKSRKKAESIVSERSSRADESILGRIPTVPDNLLV